MKIDLSKTTLTQFLKLYGFGWDILEKNKLISNRTYYRWLNGETTPRDKKAMQVAEFLKVSKEEFLQLLDNEIKARKK